MRVLVFHGYLLRGTGSNVYNANLAAALVDLGHEVHLVCQERSAEDLPFVDAVGNWDSGALEVVARRESARCTVYRPDIGGLLPVYVADRYEGVEARPFQDCSEAEVDSYVEANVAAVREVEERSRPDVALANHLVMGPLVLARALAATPYAVKIHGSALEFTVKPHPRFLPHAREGLAGARGVLVGSRHVARSLWDALGDDSARARTRLGPPGVDLAMFAPREPAEARAGLVGLAAGLRSGSSEARSDTDSAFARDERAAADAVETLTQHDGPLVAYVGKLLRGKGVDLLLAAWPRVVERVPDARLVLVGFGGFEGALVRLAAALGAADLPAARRLAVQEGLDHVRDFLDDLEPNGTERYVAAAARCMERIAWTGRLEHAELAELLPACEAQVVPSTFPEAFGMVAAEAAACGALPVSAAHSGLAEVTETLAGALPEETRGLLAFPLGPAAVGALAERLVAWLEAPEPVRAATRRALVATARERYGWDGVARGVLAAAEGRLDELPDAT